MYTLFPVLIALVVLQTCETFMISNNQFASRSKNVLFVAGKKKAGGPPPRVKAPTNRDKQMLDVFEQIDYQRTPNEPEFPIEEDPSLPFVRTVIDAADGRKAADIHAMRVSHITEVTTFMVIIEGNSRPQNQAIANAVEVSLLSVVAFLDPLFNISPFPNRRILKSYIRYNRRQQMEMLLVDGLYLIMVRLRLLHWHLLSFIRTPQSSFL
jgi:hypothetical protein